MGSKQEVQAPSVVKLKALQSDSWESCVPGALIKLHAASCVLGLLSSFLQTQGAIALYQHCGITHDAADFGLCGHPGGVAAPCTPRAVLGAAALFVSEGLGCKMSLSGGIVPSLRVLLLPCSSWAPVLKAELTQLSLSGDLGTAPPLTALQGPACGWLTCAPWLP